MPCSARRECYNFPRLDYEVTLMLDATVQEILERIDKLPEAERLLIALAMTILRLRRRRRHVHPPQP